MEDRKKTIFSCPHCNDHIYRSIYKYRAHLFVHKKESSRFKCDYCLREFYRHDTYAKHVKKHENTKSVSLSKEYICDHCNRRFLNKFNITVHLKTHGTVDPKIGKFSCAVCKETYTENRTLKRHVRNCHYNLSIPKRPTHLDKMIRESWIEKVSNTDECVKITKLNNNIITIVKCETKIKTEKVCQSNKEKTETRFFESHGHFSNVVCDFCKRVMLKKSLIKHIRETHLKIKKFKCSKCKTSFSRKYQLLNHKNQCS